MVNVRKSIHDEGTQWRSPTHKGLFCPPFWGVRRRSGVHTPKSDVLKLGGLFGEAQTRSLERLCCLTLYIGLPTTWKCWVGHVGNDATIRGDEESVSKSHQGCSH